MRAALLGWILLVAACSAAPAPTVEVTGHAHAGPVCPVMRVPPEESCEDVPVGGATVRITDPAGTTVAEAVTDATGWFAVRVEPGTYRLVAEPVAGLLGTPAPLEFTAPAQDPLDLAYDTGIR